MTAKHSPATPLPWGALEHQHLRPMEDAGYLFHAANAYPTLVAAIKGQYAGTFEQLLRELGEAE